MTAHGTEPSANIVGTCDVCAETGPQRSHRASEDTFHNSETFRYLECQSCGSLSLVDVPDDLGRYYPDDYYSFAGDGDADVHPALVAKLRFHLLRGALRNRTTAKGAFWIAARLGILVEPWVRLLGNVTLSSDSRILDVGCGSGHRLKTLQRFGFRDLTGIDAHMPDRLVDPEARSGPRLVRGTVADLSEPFDLAMFHHSFEHMAQPVEVLRAVQRILSPQGAVIVRVPLAQTFAWRTYGVQWVQLDVPRHLFLFTAEGLRVLAARSGLVVRDVVYDSNDFQFWGSELRVRGIPLRQHGRDAVPPAALFPRRELARFRRQAHQLNARSDGDQAAFLLTRQR
ncbi:MAG TPA: class I SAM-dependent methyltransferase [Acidimicrobiales bacterium]|nr:class I SAM-dependent methyltransferase [Acidimicrobiales bacterium]